MKSLALPKLDLNEIADQFRNLNTQDVGSWPLAPRVASLLAIFAAIAAAGWWFDWSGQLEELEAKRAEEQRLRQEYVSKKKQAVNLELYRQQLAEIDRSFGALLKQLPSKAEMESLLVEVNQAGLGRGLQFELFKPGAEAIKDFYAEMPITVKVSGGYHDFGAFASDIGRLSRIVTLNDLNIAASQTKGREGALVMEAQAKTFRYLDEEEIAQQKKAAQAAKAGGRK